MSKSTSPAGDQPAETANTPDEYIREHEEEYRDLAEKDEEFSPLIEAALEDVTESGGGE